MNTVKNQKSEYAKVPLAISLETYALIMCLDSLSKHWDQVNAALQKAYHEKTVISLRFGGYVRSSTKFLISQKQKMPIA